MGLGGEGWGSDQSETQGTVRGPWLGSETLAGLRDVALTRVRLWAPALIGTVTWMVVVVAVVVAACTPQVPGVSLGCHDSWAARGYVGVCRMVRQQWAAEGSLAGMRRALCSLRSIMPSQHVCKVVSFADSDDEMVRELEEWMMVQGSSEPPEGPPDDSDALARLLEGVRRIEEVELI